MKKLSIVVITLIMFIAANEALAQFTLSGEFRPRAEINHGTRNLILENQDLGFFVTQRTRLNVDYKSKSGSFRTYLSLQDVRTWGNQRQLVSNEDFATSIHQAWGEAFIGSAKTFSIKFGRQEVILDDHRIFGNVGWAQQARSHDLMILKYTDPDVITIQLAGGLNQAAPGRVGTTYTMAGSYKSMVYLWANKKFGEKLEVSLLFLNLGFQKSRMDTVAVDSVTNEITEVFSDNNYTQTIGTHLKYKTGGFFLMFNGYYQFGKANQMSDPNNISAFLLALELGYKVSDKVTLIIGHEMQSGQTKTETDADYNNTQHAFTPYFGTNHKFNGFMDYFYVGNHIGNVGLNDSYFKAKFKVKKVSFGVDVHMFMSGAKIQDPAGTTGTESLSSYMGTEIDLYGGFKISKGVSCKLGYSQMIATESMEVIKGFDPENADISSVQNWAWVMVVFKPTFFTTKKAEPKSNTSTGL